MEKHPACEGKEHEIKETPCLEDADVIATEGEQKQPLTPEQLLAMTHSALEEATNKLEELTKEKEELQDRYLRLQADFDNYRRRTRQDIAEADTRAVAKFILEILPLIDNLHLAARSPSEQQSDQSVAAGVKMVLEQFTEVLSSVGVQPIAAVGQEYNPSIHEALMTVETDEIAPGWITEELRCGYIQGERVLRPSLVKVATAVSPPEPVANCKE